ncbi:MAG TPA: cellulase-like family protein [Terracidiphilus sp.]|nr:cellulase-like family protein [Terracidiphilus sp.]
MNRRAFLAGAAACAALNSSAAPSHPAERHPRAITMWEFSWIERRWPGAGYEDWDQALDALVERGYDAVRIDPFPHLLATDPDRSWTLLPEWNTQLWGSPDVNRITLMPALTDFLTRCRARGIRVGLSTWYRQDQDNTRMQIAGPGVQAAQWIRTLDIIRTAGLLDTILYTDLCNEWPGIDWAPFVTPRMSYGDWRRPESLAWMHSAIALVREQYPAIPLFYSFSGGFSPSDAPKLTDLDLLDPHIWMTQQNDGEFYRLVGYNYERFDPRGYTNLSLKADDTYRARPAYWLNLLTQAIDSTAASARQLQIPLITTECWAIVDYKDWPLLKWDWVKDLCALGVKRAAGSGQWLAVATSNFCGPQFVGMWRDKEWHQRQTQIIKSAQISPGLRHGRFYKNL